MPMPPMNTALGKLTMSVAHRVIAEATCEIIVTMRHRTIFEKNTVL